MSTIYIPLLIISITLLFFVLWYEHRKDVRYKNQKKYLNKLKNNE